MKKHNILRVVLLVVSLDWLLAAIFLPDANWANLVKVTLTLVELFLIIFSVKEKHNIVKVVIITTLVFLLLTWILPAAIIHRLIITMEIREATAIMAAIGMWSWIPGPMPRDWSSTWQRSPLLTLK